MSDEQVRKLAIALVAMQLAMQYRHGRPESDFPRAKDFVDTIFGMCDGKTISEVKADQLAAKAKGNEIVQVMQAAVRKDTFAKHEEPVKRRRARPTL